MTLAARAAVLPPMKASVSAEALRPLAGDDDQERRSRLLLLDETGGLRRASRPACDRSLGRNAIVRERPHGAIASRHTR